MTEKPECAEVGQSWKQCGCVWLVTGVDEKRDWPVRARLVEKPADLGGGNPVGYESWGFRLDSFRIGYDFLGYAPGYGPEEARGAMPACGDGDPIGCLKCGGPKDNTQRGFICFSCAPQPYVETKEFLALIRDWKDGARDFPRAPEPVAPEPTFITDRVEIAGSDNNCHGARIGNLSALDIIQARDRLPKPEPWVPSIDEWDLLPDA